MKRITRSVFCVYTFYAAMCSYSQAVLTANETVSAYENSLRFGINLGAPKGLWTDQA